MKAIKNVPEAQEALRLPATTDVITAGKYFGLGPDAVRLAIAEGSFPIPVLAIGGRRRVTRAALLAALGVEASPGGGRSADR
jgi:hypothetical protein